MNNFKSNMSLLRIVGIVLLLTGIIFTIVGIILLTIPSFIIAGILLLGFNAQFLMVGLIFIINDISKKKRMKSILKEGFYIEAEVTDILQNHEAKEEKNPFYTISAEYEDETGCIHIFKSPNLNFNPENMLLDRIVRIYIKPGDYQYYYMDINSILPEVKVHR